MRFLLIGNMGYIGPVVAGHLRRTFPNASLVGFDSGYFGGCLIDPAVFPESILNEQIYGDVRTLRSDVLKGVDVVIQLAAISNDPMGREFEAVTEEINSAAAARIARLAHENGARAFVFASSCSVYGAGDDTAKSESSRLDPLTAYARSKISAERRLASIAAPGYSITCLRFATACGWSPRLRLDLVLNDFVASAVTTKRISILSDGTPWRPLIHVSDMARAIEWAALRHTHESDPFLVVNAGSEAWNYQVRELADAVANIAGGVEVFVNPNAAPDKRSYRVDFTKFGQLAPQHQPVVSLADAVSDLVDRLRLANFNDTDFRKSALIRLNVLKTSRDQGRLTHELYPAK